VAQLSDYILKNLMLR